MNRLLSIALLAFLSSTHHAQCESVREFGYKEICLPELIGMTECYDDPLVKFFFDQFRGTDEEIIVGAYLLDDIFENRYLTFFEDGCGDDYIKMFSLEPVKDMYAGKEELDLVFESMTETLTDNSDGGSNKIINNAEERLLETGILENIEIGIPTVIDKYEINSTTRNCILLTKMIADGYEFIQVQTLNITILKNRMFMYAYYKTYEGPESIKQAKQNSDYFGYSLSSKN